MDRPEKLLTHALKHFKFNLSEHQTYKKIPATHNLGCGQSIVIHSNLEWRVFCEEVEEPGFLSRLQ